MTAEELVAQLDVRFQQLAVLQQEMGQPLDSRENEKNALVSDLIQLADQHVHTMTQHRDALNAQCEQIRTNIITYYRLLGEPVPSTTTIHVKQDTLQATADNWQTEETAIKQRYDAKLAIVQELYSQLKHHAVVLSDFANVNLMTDTEIDVSPSAMDQLKEEIRRCENEYLCRIDHLQECAKQLKQLWSLLGLGPQTEKEQLLQQLHPGLGGERKDWICRELLKGDALNHIMHKIAELEEMKQQREFRKHEIEGTLYPLWDKLGVDPEEYLAFLETSNGLSDADLEKYEMEKERLLRMKLERAEEFTLKVRDELHQLWDQLYFSTDERKQFKPAFTDEFNNHALKAHEDELARLQLLIEDRKYILEKVERHRTLMKEVEEFQATTNDPSRLLGRGNRDPGRLLREEKFRKRIAKELPKIKKELEGALREYQISTGTPFTVYGKPYIEIMQESEKSNKPKPTARAELMVEDDMPFDLSDMSPSRNSTRRAALARGDIFRTPQPIRVRDMGDSVLALREEWQRELSESSSSSILHRVRENNLKKRVVARASHRKALRRQRTGGAAVTVSSGSDENVAPFKAWHEPMVAPTKSSKRGTRRPEVLTRSDDELSLDLGVFDDGPELSDMSEDGFQ
ncbi:microtubule associated protein-domain-containing protein [Radiomyces spectabilis]|uniref:microtubule associated protein-domain-containing protein n=1 Tax=Radiomyces spectabilis TaxID=64574 RepID=UPI00221F2AFB|nr:microtubule associated protein-domain-containing protein [Radiomyces spectabilis]KAI8372949.1 microtubule associated protein-domain-containing protein [Radiomyces spectabilis]